MTAKVNTALLRLLKALGIPGSLDFGLHQGIVPTVDISSLIDLEADLAAQPEQGFMFGEFKQGVAAQFSRLQLYNPVGSGRVGFLDRMMIAQAASGFIQFAEVQTQYATNAGKQNKVAGTTGTLAGLQFRHDSNVDGFLPGGATLLVANAPAVLRFYPPVRLPEGWAFSVVGGIVNTTVAAHFQWRERGAGVSQL